MSPARILRALDNTGVRASGASDGLVFSVAVALALLFLMARLGHYPLWEDEALTALAARAIIQTGDTSAVVDHNLVAFRGGLHLYNLCDRAIPPLPSYLAAGAFCLLGENAFAARFPFAVCGALAVILLLSCARWNSSSSLSLWLTVAAVLGNASFFLYARQCRYYGVVLALSTLIARLYFINRLRGRYAIAAGICSVGLFSCHYVTWLSLLCCMLVDYAIWERGDGGPRKRDVIAALSIHVLALPIAFIWNPFLTGLSEYPSRNSFTDRCLLWLWHWRDLCRCEFLSGGLLILAAVLAVRLRDMWLRRGLVALVILITVTCALSPQPVQETSVADVRYVVPAIPLGIMIGVRSILLVAQRTSVIAALCAMCAFGTNILNGGLFTNTGPQSTIALYGLELIQPVEDPYSPTIKWIKSDVRAGESVWVVPDYMTYPLMFHAPAPTYAWQLSAAEGQFANVADIHVAGRVPPDYVIAFGPIAAHVESLLEQWNAAGVRYHQSGILRYHWQQLYRPELFWRTFKTIPYSQASDDGIHIYRRAAQ